MVGNIYQNSKKNLVFLFFMLVFSFLIGGIGAKSGKVEKYRIITVQKGETLSIIAKKYLNDPRKWRELLKYNKIKKPNLIFPGAEIKIPDSLAKKPLAIVLYKQDIAEYFSRSVSRWGKLKVNNPLYNRDIIRTRRFGKLKLAIKNFAVIYLPQNTYIVLNESAIGKIGKTRIYLKKGRIRSVIQSNRDKKINFWIKTPSAVAYVRGTDFFSSVDSKGNSSYGCYKGVVAVKAQGKEVLLKKGMGTLVKKGKPPLPPFKIPTVPKIKRF